MIEVTYTVRRAIPTTAHWHEHHMDREIADMLGTFIEQRVSHKWSDFEVNYGSHAHHNCEIVITYDELELAEQAEKHIDRVLAEWLPGLDDEQLVTYMQQAVPSAQLIYHWDVDMYEEYLEQETACGLMSEEESTPLIERLESLRELVRQQLGTWCKCVLMHEHHLLHFYSTTQLTQWGRVWYDNELYYVRRLP